jgi:class 3 adenylate cyclase/tetratricopeptide (TPR) repeat protein
MGCGATLATAVPVGVVREERKVVTVLFADLVGFTARSERLDPEDVRAFLLPYYDVLMSEVTRTGGIVDRFLGDGIMALFGAPTAHEEDPERAVRAALAIAERVPALGLGLRVRIGINTGPVLFTAGGPGHDEAVTGDTVNTAARLQAVAPTDGVVVGEPTYRATAHCISYEALPQARVKGKAEPLALWRALGPLARPAGELPTETTPFVGRELERSLLVSLFERCRSTPSTEVVTIVADPGMGKSRLARELVHHVESLPDLVTVRVGRCQPYGEGIGLWALGEIVRAQAGILDTDDQAALAAKLEAVLTEPDPSMRAWMKDRLAPLVGLETSTQPPRQEEAFTAWRRFIESIAAAGPTVVVVEDLHLADDALVGFLAHLAEHAVGLPLLVVTTARPELEERHPAWLGRTRRSTVFSLAALPDADIERLLAAVLGAASPELRSTVLERAAGSPLYAEQLAAMFSERLMPIAGGSLDEDAIPPSVQALLAARIDALPPAAKAVLLDASVVGRTFWSGAIAALAGRDPVELDPALSELARREFVRPVIPSSMADETEYAFWHALLRDVAYAQLTRSARLARHRTAAAWLRDRPGTALGEDAEIVVAHLERAHELASAAGVSDEATAIQADLVDALVVAADHAMRTDVPRAVAHLRRILDRLEEGDERRPEVLARLGRGFGELEEHADAIVAIEEAQRLFRVLGRDREAAGLAVALGRSYLTTGDAPTADRLFEEAGEIMARERDPALAEYVAFAAKRAWSMSRHDEALALAEEALSLAQDLGAPIPYLALNARGCVRLGRGDRTRGEGDVRRAIELAVAAGDHGSTLVALNNLSNGLSWYSISDAAAATEEELEYARSHGLTRLFGDLDRASWDFALGRWEQALAGAIAQEERAVERGDAFTHLFATGLRTRIELERGSCTTDPADVAAEARSFGRWYALENLLPVAALLAVRQGKRSLAASLLEELIDACPGVGNIFPAVEACEAAVEAGRVDLARVVRDLAPRPVRRGGLPDAIVAEAEGDHEASRGWYARAVDDSRAVGDVPQEARALAGLGRCLLALSQADEGIARLEESRAIWERLKATPRLAEIDTLLAAATASPRTP